jgi:hypothetical protein
MISCRFVRILMNRISSCRIEQHEPAVVTVRSQMHSSQHTSPPTSSSPSLTLSTILAIALAYFRPCSPSNITPECRMIAAPSSPRPWLAITVLGFRGSCCGRDRSR